MLAADVGTGQPEIVAQEIGEVFSRLDLAGEGAAVDAQGDGVRGGHRLKLFRIQNKVRVFYDVSGSTVEILAS